ncbi:hypothetical protein WJX79_006308 [Trebouxia sp. C0005]
MLGTIGVNLVPGSVTSKFVKVTNFTPFRQTAQRCAAWPAQPQALSKSSGRRISHSPKATAHSRNRACAAAGGDQLRALILDCDGVIFYDDLQNRVGGGKAKMRWYFGEHGWPSSTMFSEAPKSEEQQTALIDALQEWKSKRFQEIVGSDAEARPGIMRLMDEARQASVKVAVCSAATKSSVIHVVKSLLGEERFKGLDVFLAGDDVPAKKPDPSIYTLAAERLGLQPSECLVVEDSAIGLQAAVDAGMRCIITYTNSSHSQGFSGAELIVSNLDAASHPSEFYSPGVVTQGAEQRDSAEHRSSRRRCGPFQSAPQLARQRPHSQTAYDVP